MELLPLSLLQRLVALVPEPYRAEVVAGLRSLEVPAAQLGLELLDMESAGVPYAEAVRNETRFPRLARFHFGVLDLLQFELPAEVLEHVRTVVREVSRANLDGIRRDLFLLAATAPGVPGAICRTLFIEALWLNAVLACWSDQGLREATGCLELAGVQAQELFERARTDARLRGPTALPLESLVAELLHDIDHMWERLAPQIAEQSVDGQRRLHAIARATRAARGLGAADAAIVRSIAEQMRTGEPIGSQRIVDRHVSVFGQANTVDKQLSRLQERRAARKPPKRVHTRIIDILFDELSEQSR